jgi:hypothetical protein
MHSLEAHTARTRSSRPCDAQQNSAWRMRAGVLQCASPSECTHCSLHGQARTSHHADNRLLTHPPTDHIGASSHPLTNTCRVLTSVSPSHQYVCRELTSASKEGGCSAEWGLWRAACRVHRARCVYPAAACYLAWQYTDSAHVCRVACHIAWQCVCCPTGMPY